jgi:hypothetical protein
VVRAVVLDDVFRDTEPVLGGQLLEGGLPVQPGAECGRRLDQRVEEPVDGHGGGLEAAGQVDGAEDRFDRVGEDRCLVAATGGLLTAAELDVLTERDLAADAGQRTCIDDGRAQLGQAALGQLGMAAVERLGDDDTEHGVAEELEALVGGEPAVLVRERAVRQRSLQQLGVQDRIPEGVT